MKLRKLEQSSTDCICVEKKQHTKQRNTHMHRGNVCLQFSWPVLKYFILHYKLQWEEETIQWMASYCTAQVLW